MKTIVTDIPSREAFFKGRGTLEVGYPWLSFGAIIALESIVSKEYKVLEFGSGGSTIFWAERCGSVKSFETNHKWYENVKKRVERFKNVEITLTNEKETLEAIEKEPDNYYDLVLIDPNPQDVRRILLANAVVPKIKLNGWLVIDNYEKHRMGHFNYQAWDVYTFDEFCFSGRGTRICKKIK